MYLVPGSTSWYWYCLALGGVPGTSFHSERKYKITTPSGWYQVPVPLWTLEDLPPEEGVPGNGTWYQGTGTMMHGGA